MEFSKKHDERFFYGWMSWQDFPNTTNRPCVIVPKDFDCSSHDLVNGEVVEIDPPFTGELV